MSESYYLIDEPYTSKTSMYEINGNDYVLNCSKYILEIDTYTIIDEVSQYGVNISTSNILHNGYEVSIDSYVYCPPLPRYTAWTFGEAIWSVVKVAGAVIGCITFCYTAVTGGLIMLFKTIAGALLDIAEMVGSLITRATIDIFPRIRYLWPRVYHGIIDFFTSGNHAGFSPCFVRDKRAGHYALKWIHDISHIALDESLSVPSVIDISDAISVFSGD